jgi:hypothetical protein
MNTHPSLPAQADLRYLLHLHPGQRAALHNVGQALLLALQNDGIAVESLDAPGKLHALFIAPPLPNGLTATLTHAAQRLHPGGQVLLCTPNRHSLNALFGKSVRTERYSLSAIRKAAQNAGLSAKAHFGLYNSLNEPRIFVPLAERAAAHHFFTNMLIPYSRGTRQLLTIAPILLALGWQTALFTDLAIVLEMPC